MPDTNLTAKEYFKARQKAWRESGKCNDCSKPPLPGKSRCEDCAEKAALASQRHHARKKAEKKNPRRG